MIQKFKIEIDIDRIKKNVKKSLESYAKKGIKIIQKEITDRGLVKTGNLKKNVKATVLKKSINFRISAPYAEHLNRGVRKHKMTYLKNVRVPFKSGSGKRAKLSFKTANKIGKNGRWIHPGFKGGKKFIDVASDKIVDDISERIAKLEIQ